MTLSQTYNSLCSPAKLYLVIQSVAILLLFIQNLRDTNHYRVGSYKIPLGHHNIYYFFVKIFVLVTWTWLLNKLCTKQYEGVAWFLVLIPFILFFVGIGMVVVTGLNKSNQFGSSTTNYQPIYMRQAPSHTVLAAGHTASCQCPKCGPPAGRPTSDFSTLSYCPTSPPMVYGRQRTGNFKITLSNLNRLLMFHSNILFNKFMKYK